MTTANNLASLGSAGVSAGFKNRIINGAMVIDQRNAGAAVTNAATTTYTLDRYQMFGDQASKFSIQQVATTMVGFTYALKVTSLSSYTLTTDDRFFYRQKIEGYNIADLGWGTASAKTITLSFKVKSSLTGTFGGSLQNGAGDRSYPFTYTIASANTETAISITVAGDTSGTWLTTNGVGIALNIGLGVQGSTYAGTAGTWASANYYSATGATNVVSTNGATLEITGVQLEVGTTATNFDYRPYGQELALCQRYCFVAGNSGYAYQNFSTGIAVSSTLVESVLAAPVQMRTQPTLALSGANRLTDEVSVFSLSSASVSSSNSGTQMLTLNLSSSGLTLFRFYYFSANGDGATKLTFSAEL